MVFEIRTYLVGAGTAARCAQLLQSVVAPLFTEIGVDVVTVGPSLAVDLAGAGETAYLVLAHRNVAEVTAADERLEALAEWSDGRRDELVALVHGEHRVAVPQAALVGLGYRS